MIIDDYKGYGDKKLSCNKMVDEKQTFELDFL